MSTPLPPPKERSRLASDIHFEKLVALLHGDNEAVDFLLIAGDLYDGDSRDFKTALFLVKQMGRVSALPVQLAKAGEAVQAAHVYVLPDDVAVEVNQGVVRFDEGQLDVDRLIASLPPAESAVVLLSGGLDSCVCLAGVLTRYDAAVLHLDYGQRTQARERAAFLGGRFAYRSSPGKGTALALTLPKTERQNVSVDR